MATIDDLNTSILKMSNQQAFNLIREIRQSRITKKVTKFTVKASRPKTPRKKKDPLSGIAKEELIKLLKESLKENK